MKNNELDEIINHILPDLMEHENQWYKSKDFWNTVDFDYTIENSERRWVDERMLEFGLIEENEDYADSYRLTRYGEKTATKGDWLTQAIQFKKEKEVLLNDSQLERRKLIIETRLVEMKLKYFWVVAIAGIIGFVLSVLQVLKII